MFSQKSGKENSNIFIVNTAFCPNCVNGVLRHRIMLLPHSLPGDRLFLLQTVVLCMLSLSLRIYLLSSHVMYIDLLKSIPHQINSLSLYPYPSRWPLPSNNRPARSRIPHQYGNKKLDKVPPYTEPRVAYITSEIFRR